MRTPRSTELLGPVVTFRVTGASIAIAVAQMQRVVVAQRLNAIPLTRDEHWGLWDDGRELVPILGLNRHGKAQGGDASELLVVIVHVRGDSVGMAIEHAGHLYTTYELAEAPLARPEALREAATALLTGGGQTHWLIDTDRLWSNATESSIMTSV